ncbi:MAG TPA: ABC transporter permease [Micromonospora sp.]
MRGFVGTWQLVRLYLRRDRIKLPVGILVLVAIVASNLSGFASLYETAQERAAFAKGVNGNAAQLFMYGPVFNGETLGGLVAWRSIAIAGILIGLVNLFLVIRHTRAEEESGRAELVRAGVVGRYAELTAALVVAVLGNLAIALLLVGTMTSKDLPRAGAAALAFGLAAVGCVFAAVGAVTAQLTENARTARGMASAVLGVTYLFRAVGDASRPEGDSWLGLLSPIGWLQRMRPFAGDRWGMLGLALVVAVVLASAAFVLSTRRDVGAGIMPARLGPPAAPPGLRSPLALAWRLHQPALIGWTVGFLAIGAVVGGAAKSIGDQLDSNPALKEVFEKLGGSGDLVDAYLAAAMGILGMLAAAYAVQAALRPHAEESSGRAEPVLATRTTRISWATSHMVFALLGPAVALAAGGLAAGLVYGATTQEVGRQVPRLLGGALVQLPAVWILAGITVALFGLAPRMIQAAWGALVVFLLLGQLGGAFGWDQKLLDISPFTHIPPVPSADLTVTPLVSLVVLAGVLVAAGLAGFRRRGIG